jgi:EAL domain-containing protein (putative c-di-GMP-specific phosphodiesterase class I)
LLTLEITEQAAIEDLQVARHTLQALRALGVRVAIDDFGTGFSSLSYLSRLPADTVKIDRAFVRRVAADPRDRRVVRAIADLAHDLGMDVTAEGIETTEQCRVLREISCDRGQGYLWSPPVAAEDVARWREQPASLPPD